MYKSICVVAVLLAAFAFMSGSRPATASASATTYPPPQIVAKGKVINQTAEIPTTTILTPPQSGLYRLSVYGTVTTAAQTSNSYWYFAPRWIDDSGILSSQTGILTSIPGSQGPFLWSNVAEIGATIVIEVKGGTAITYSVSQSGPPDGSTYSLYYTLERLE